MWCCLLYAVVVRCLLFVGCWLLCVVCCGVLNVCGFSFVCCLLFVGYRVLVVDRCVSFDVRCFLAC